MSGYDDMGVFHSDNLPRNTGAGDYDLRKADVQAMKNKFREFLLTYTDYAVEGNPLMYREQIKKHYNLGQFWVEIVIEHVSRFHELLANAIITRPGDFLGPLEEVAQEVADQVTRPREDDDPVQLMQVMFRSTGTMTPLRAVSAKSIGSLVKIPGIIISASSIKAKATSVSLQCRGCKEIIPNVSINTGLEGFMLPRKCNTDQTGLTVKCPLDPFTIMPDKCRCIDFQVLKLQEAPEAVPHGEMPRHMQLYVDRYLCEKVVPGNRVYVYGVFAIKKIASGDKRGAGGETKANAGIRVPYIKVMGIELQTDGGGRAGALNISEEEEEEFKNLANSPDVYQRIASSIAPSIYGNEDIKKSIACLLFGGSRKRLPDGLTRRGDINVLLLGDPGTAKSQLLKFVEKVSPIGVYTSGKGSSAAGLTAAVIRDPSSRNFVMEGGAMVLADGGCVCIDEFDKMREDDRVAIHEAMEQQTISIAKAGITTTLNSRCAVLAAANSVFGRWDDSKSDANIEFMPTILARFDMIYIVKDEHNEKRDNTLAMHVMRVHMNAGKATEDKVEGELSLEKLKKFISYCKAKCGPRLSESAATFLRDNYVEMRNGAKEQMDFTQKKSTIPITVRQLEALVRIAESLAKMKLKSFVHQDEVEEALRLFTVSTLAAAKTGELSGAEGFTSEQDQEHMIRIEKNIKKRFPVGSQLPESNLIQTLVEQGFDPKMIFRVLHGFIRREELKYRQGKKMLYRLK